MSLKFFADHCISNFIIKSLRDAGHEVIRLKDVIPPDSSDPIVISKALELNSILLSLNGDFTDIVTYPPARYNGIVALQVRNHPEVIPHLMARLGSYLSKYSDMKHYKGKLLLVEAHRIRVR
ncbi:hypothetical protein MNBD_NITROSPIRAE02-676 [hydrothermal vent metagenome]|uniref:DUF5615 domain-containing protein n=1 Tax=hydrothermal vent metagenome TaxID=652676 RepID=A0A3B1CY91_9ZZZZ